VKSTDYQVLSHRVQKGYGPHPASYPVSNVGSFPMGKVPWSWIWSLMSIMWRG